MQVFDYLQPKDIELVSVKSGASTNKYHTYNNQHKIKVKTNKYKKNNQTQTDISSQDQNSIKSLESKGSRNLLNFPLKQTQNYLRLKDEKELIKVQEENLKNQLKDYQSIQNEIKSIKYKQQKYKRKVNEIIDLMQQNKTDNIVLEDVDPKMPCVMEKSYKQEYLRALKEFFNLNPSIEIESINLHQLDYITHLLQICECYRCECKGCRCSFAQDRVAPNFVFKNQFTVNQANNQKTQPILKKLDRELVNTKQNFFSQTMSNVVDPIPKNSIYGQDFVKSQNKLIEAPRMNRQISNSQDFHKITMYNTQFAPWRNNVRDSLPNVDQITYKNIQNQVKMSDYQDNFQKKKAYVDVIQKPKAKMDLTPQPFEYMSQTRKNFMGQKSEIPRIFFDTEQQSLTQYRNKEDVVGYQTKNQNDFDLKSLNSQCPTRQKENLHLLKQSILNIIKNEA